MPNSQVCRFTRLEHLRLQAATAALLTKYKFWNIFYHLSMHYYWPKLKLSTKTYSPSTIFLLLREMRCELEEQLYLSVFWSENATKREKTEMLGLRCERDLNLYNPQRLEGKTWVSVLAKTIIDIKRSHWWWLYGPIWPLTTTSILLWINLCILTENATCNALHE